MGEPQRDPLREALERIAAIDAAIEARKAGGTEPVVAMILDAYPVLRAALAAPLPAEPSGAAIAAAANTRSLRERGVRVDEWVGGIQAQAAYERAVGCDVRAAYAIDRGATDHGAPGHDATLGLRLVRHLRDVQAEDGCDAVGQETNDLMWWAARHFGLRTKQVEHTPAADCTVAGPHHFSECGSDAAILEFEATDHGAPASDVALAERRIDEYKRADERIRAWRQLERERDDLAAYALNGLAGNAGEPTTLDPITGAPPRRPDEPPDPLGFDW